MKAFSCQNCGHAILFENVQCLRCLRPLGYLPEFIQMSSFEQSADQFHSDLSHKDYKVCKNGRQYQACNWMIDAEADEDYCLSCSFNQTIPNVSIAQNLHHWQILESGKRRLLYSLQRLNLPLINKKVDPDNGLAFEFLKDTSERIQANDRVMTGHVDGVITLNLAEADDAERERRRITLNEDYRTVLGHFRHESGHYYWKLLVEGQHRLDSFRQLFSDERINYQSAVSDYYARGPAKDWQNNHISAYASSHPWEDFAEIWGHYLTIADTLETSREFGVSISGSAAAPPEQFDSYHASTFDAMLERWLPLTFAVNNINRSGGRPDLYPFVLSATVIEKLRYVHSLIRQVAP